MPIFLYNYLFGLLLNCQFDKLVVLFAFSSTFELPEFRDHESIPHFKKKKTSLLSVLLYRKFFRVNFLDFRFYFEFKFFSIWKK